MNRKTSNLMFSLLVVLFAIYAGVFIYKTIITVSGQKYFFLFDDAMISMQYARNLALGNGPVFNPGDRVEGYSNPLWVAYMAIFHLLPIASSKISLLIQVSGAVFLIANLYYVRKITDYFEGSEPFVALVAVFLTAFYYPLNQWSLLGMEVSVLTLMVSVAVWLVLQSLQNRKFSPWIYVLLGVSTLVRIDMLGIGLATWAFLILVDSKNRVKNGVWGLLILAAFVAGQTALRYWYYGDVFPNTYYLKMTGSPLLLRLKRGIFTYVKFAWNFNIVLYLLPFLLPLFRRDKATWYLFLVFAVQSAYSIYVGGDAWEHRGGANRFYAIVMPIFMILFALTLEELRKAIMQRIGGGRQAEKEKESTGFDLGALRQAHRRPFLLRGEFLSQVVVAGFALLSLVNFNALLDTLSLQYAVLAKPSIYVIGQEKILRIGLQVKEMTTPQATVLAIAAGGVPYFSERYTYDLLGKSDKVIAHEAMHIDPAAGLIDFRPGHNKWDYAYSIGQLKPDVIPEIWEGTLEEAKPYLKDYTVIQLPEFKRWLPDGVMYVRTGSPNIRWDVIQPYIIKSSGG